VNNKILQVLFLAILGVFLFSKLNAAEAEDKMGSIKVSVQTGQAQVIKDTGTVSGKTSQKTVADVKKSTDTAVSRLQRKADKLQAELPQMKIQENVVRVRPDVNINLPSGAFDLTLQQAYGKSIFSFSTNYDLVHNLMGFGLDFLFKVKPFPLGLAMKDKVDFQDVFFGSEYIQRVKSLSPYSRFPVFANTDGLAAVRFETTMTGALGVSPVDQGHNLIGEIGIFNSTVDLTKPIPAGGSRSFDIQRSFANLGSDYNYCQQEIKIRQFAETFKKSYIEYNLFVGYPMSGATPVLTSTSSFSEGADRPLSSVYWLGGYQTLLGYYFRQFEGFCEIYNRLDYNVSLAGTGQAKLFGLNFSIVTLRFFAEAAKIGGKEIFSGFSDAKYDAGSGIGYTAVLFDLIPLKFEVVAAKAFEAERPLKLYFMISTLGYSFGNGK
jgi:hypothetical protein